MSTDTGDGARRSNADELFILVLTVLWAHRVPAPHGNPNFYSTARRTGRCGRCSSGRCGRLTGRRKAFRTSEELCGHSPTGLAALRC
jgi:hypothetical protein